MLYVDVVSAGRIDIDWRPPDNDPLPILKRGSEGYTRTCQKPTQRSRKHATETGHRQLLW
jgi:hypothetical protein